MSDEIVDVNAEEVPEEKYLLAMKKDLPEEKLGKDGKNIPDPAFIDTSDEEGRMQINEAREFASQLPQYPTEWQTGYKENTKGFDDSVDPLKLNVSFKEQEIKKLIKKYKRYMKNNLTVAKRLES
jgi:hypothetical protein